MIHNRSLAERAVHKEDNIEFKAVKKDVDY